MTVCAAHSGRKELCMKHELAKNAFVIIPAYEPEESFVTYAASLLRNSHISLIVVDDGSGEAFSSIFEEIAKLPRTTLLTHPENKGKGAAMKTAFRYCLQNLPQDTVYTVADCDGQHTVPDVLRVMKKAQKNPDALVLGVRNFSRKTVPFRSRFGNTVMAKLLEGRFGISLKDTQTGLRGFSHSLLPRMLEVEGDRFSYETAVLIALHEKGVLFHQVEIETVYHKQEETEQKVSHFRPFRDSLDVLGVLFSEFGFYFVSSVASALLDVLLFYLISKFCFAGLDMAVRILIATAIARVCSSIVNFLGNRFAFRGKGVRPIFRYYLLWTIQLSVSYGFTVLLGHFIFVPFLLSAAKALFDLVLAFFSYHIQRRWVFAPKRNKTFYFYGFLDRKSVV